MKHFSLLTLLLLVACPFSYSQSWRRLGDWGNQLTAIKWVNEEVGYIAGSNLILKSIDGGLSWSEQEAPTDHLMLALDFYDEENGMVVGRDGLVYHTLTGGKDWQTLALGTTANLNAVSYLTPDKLFISGDSSTLYSSLDGGQSWSRHQLNTSGDLNSLFFVNPDSGYIASSNSEVLKTVDGGITWKTLQTDLEFSLNDIYFLNDTVGYAVGDKGTIIKTVDAGVSWSYINSGMETDFNKVVFNKSNPLTGLVIGKNGAILRTVNGGLTFASVGSKTDETIRGISFRQNSNIVYAVGGSGLVISSVNSGGNWAIKYSGRANDYTGVQFTNDLRGYIIGDKGLILLTGNGGNSFTVRSRPLSLPFNSLYFVSNTAGYISGNNGNIISTANSGGTWTALNPGTNRDIYGMFFFSIDNGYVVGSKGYIAMTDNRGVNWTTIATGDGAIDYRDIGFFDERTGIIIGNEGWISRSEDGQNWVRIPVAIAEDLNALEIIDKTTAIIVGSRGAIFKTDDQGLSWKKIPTNYLKKLNGIKFLDESVGFIVGDKGLVLKTSDGGESFERMVTGTFQNLTDISFGDLNTGYAVGENGALFTYTCSAPAALQTIIGEEKSCLTEQVYTVQEREDAGLYYDWRVDGGTVLDGQGTSRAVIRWDSQGRNAVMVKGQNNCGSGLTAALEVLVSAGPKIVTAINGNGAVCLNALEEYSVDSLPGTEFIWEIKGGLVRSGQRTSKVIIEWTHPGDQVIKVSPKNACGEAPGFEKRIFTSTAPPKPSAIKGPSMVSLEEADYAIETVPDINYQWSTEGAGTIISGQGTGTVRISWQKEGEYILNVTPLNACKEGESQTLPINVNVITGIGRASYEPTFNVYPNPSQGNLKIVAKGISDIQEINLYNVSGQLIHQCIAKSERYEFYISRIPRGVHTVVLKSKSRNYTKMIIVR